MNLAGRRVLVVGWGRSGRAAADALVREGARVTVNDRGTAEALGIDTAALAARGIQFMGGGHPVDLFTGADLIVMSPGVDPQPHKLPALAAADAAGVPVWGEVEMGARFIRSTIVAVGGTNGKSTVTTWLAALAAGTGRPLFVGGNLGTPVCEGVGSAAFTDPDGLCVLEVSSFQMERVVTFRPHINLLLNITEDHLDRYPSFTAYADAKGNAFQRQVKGDHAIVPWRDPLCTGQAVRGAGVLWTFGAADADDSDGPDARAAGGEIVDVHAPGGPWRYDAAGIRLPGRFNRLNAAAVALAARLMGCRRSAIAAGLADFTGLPHRVAYVAEIDGVRFVDDSKGTNVASVVAAIDGLELPPGGRVVLIAGGRDKEGGYAPLAAAMQRHGRAAVLIGEAAGRIEACFAAADPAVPTIRAQTMDDAVHAAHTAARPGDTVLLSPACASFDMFRGYAHRGDVFAACVRDLAAARGG